MLTEVSSPEPSVKSQRLKITEIFLSLQGESSSVGFPTVFVRLTGCPLRCQYCDTEYAFHGGQWMGLEGIVAQVEDYHVQHVTVTGGEPLAQKACIDLLAVLCDKGFHVSLETSGALDVSDVDHRVTKVLDIKTPGSQESEKNRYENLDHMGQNDQVKFVLCDRNDYDWARQQLIAHGVADRCEVLFSPSYGQLEERVLADWILEDRLRVRFQIQLHKKLWGDEPGR